jgi:predicted O-methyltransferase YrrM
MADSDERTRVQAHLLDLHGGDPFAHVAAAAEAHRPGHGPACGLYPAGPHVMRLVASVVRAARARRLLDLGAGYGYSTLWLADAGGPDAHVDAVDRFPEHVDAARRFAADAGLAARTRFVAGDVVSALGELDGPYDLVHDDAWFASEPPYRERLLALVRPGGVVTMPNWFLLEDAITGRPRRDWSEFAGDGWQAATRAHAERLARDPRLHVTWSVSPPLAIAVRR